MADELAGGLSGRKEFDQAYEASKKSEVFRKIRYVEREEDPELRMLHEEKLASVSSLSEKLKGKVDAELDLDLHGNLKVADSQQAKQKTGIQGTGTYVLRDGKLVEGKGMVREEATFSNWYCSNADPEDLRKHRELMDRQHYRGPQWEGIGVPKSVLEEENPVYKKREAEPHPSQYAQEKSGKKEFEYVVR